MKEKEGKFKVEKKVIFLLLFCLGCHITIRSLGTSYDTLTEKYYSDDLKEGDVFIWQVDKFILNNTPASGEINNITEGSLIQLSILKDLAGYNVVNGSYTEFKEYYNITINNETDYVEYDDTIRFGFTMKDEGRGWGWGFAIVWGTKYVYESGATLSFTEEVERRLGNNNVYDLHYNESLLTWTFDNSHLTNESTKETFVYHSSTGVLLSYHEVNLKKNFECSLILVKPSSHSSSPYSGLKSTSTLSFTAKPVDTSSSFPFLSLSTGSSTAFFTLSLMILSAIKRKKCKP